MVYQAELDDVRQEARKGYASNVVRFWPKWPGVGNVSVTGTPSYTVHTPSEATVQIAAGSVTLRTVSSVSRCDIPIDASTLELDESYRIDIKWQYTDEHSVVHERLSTVRFDVVREPFEGWISLNDLLDEVADLGTRIQTLAQQVQSTRTAEQHASVLGIKGWASIRKRLRAHLATQGRILPRAIVDRGALRDVVIAETIRKVYMSNAGGFESESAQLLETWGEEVDRRFAELGEVDYDDDDDGVAEETLSGFGSSSVERSW